ncbi:MAG: DUF1853 family protein, partial [Bacteroidota bacterium]
MIQTEQLRYQGYLATPPLWLGDDVTNYAQVGLPNGPLSLDLPPALLKQRLGKRVEYYVFHQLRQAPGIDWITDSLQIRQKQRTIGEIDALYYDQGLP